MAVERPAQFTPEEERQLVAALNALIPSSGVEASLTSKTEASPIVGWLGEVRAKFGQSATTSKVAAYLAVLDPQDEEVKLRRIVKGTHISTREVEKALDVLLADGFVDIRPAIRVEAVRLKLLI